MSHLEIVHNKFHYGIHCFNIAPYCEYLSDFIFSGYLGDCHRMFPVYDKLFSSLFIILMIFSCFSFFFSIFFLFFFQYGDREARDLWSQLLPRLSQLFDGLGEIKPALLHGDLWSGNVAEDKNGPGKIIKTFSSTFNFQKVILVRL